MTRIAIEVCQAEQRKKFVGKAEKGRWKAVKTIDDAEKWTNMVLAEGAANQYLGYLREKYPNTHKSFSLNYVECD